MRDPLPRALMIHTDRFPQILSSLIYPCLVASRNILLFACHMENGIVSGVPSITQSYRLFLSYYYPRVGNCIAFTAPKGCRAKTPLIISFKHSFPSGTCPERRHCDRHLCFLYFSALILPTIPINRINYILV